MTDLDAQVRKIAEKLALDIAFVNEQDAAGLCESALRSAMRLQQERDVELAEQAVEGAPDDGYHNGVELAVAAIRGQEPEKEKGK